MAYNAKNIAPIDLKKSTALGVKIPFSYPSAFLSLYTTKDQIRNNIINYLLTNHRERIFAPNFGANIRAQLFEMIDSQNIGELEQQLASNVESNFPSIQVTQCSVSPNPDSNIITIQFSYRLMNSNESDDLIIGIQNN